MLENLPAATQVIRIEAEKHWLASNPGPMKRRLLLYAGSTEVPVLLASGTRPGPRLVVFAGVHGDEFEGIRALFEVFERLNPEEMEGSLVAIPIAHPAAFRSATRRSPEDGSDLARSFPGHPNGTPTERTAALLAEHVIAHADLFLDLHSGGLRYEMPSMIGCNATNPGSVAAAEAFGAGAVWMHDVIGPGRTISFAGARNIPWLYTEAAGAGRIATGDLEMMKNGILNLLTHLGIVKADGPGKETSSPIRLRGEGNTDRGIEAGAEGLLAVRVKLLEDLLRGCVLGELLDEFGRILETYRAPQDGVVVMIHQFARVQKGETLFLLAERV